MAFIKEFMSGVIKKFEIFERFYEYKDIDIDFKTRIDEYEIDDMTYLHTLHDYWEKEWGYVSPINQHLERKKRLRVSRNGEGRKEMSEILREAIQEEDKKGNWDKMMGVG